MGPQNKSDNVSSMGQLINQSWEHTQGEIWNEIKDQDRLYECRRVLPQQHKGIDCEALKNNKIRAISLHPLDDVYPLSDWILGDLFSTLNKIKFITILRLSRYNFQTYTAVGDKTVDQLGGGNHNESLYWDKIHELAEKYSDIPLIITRMLGDGARYRYMVNQLLSRHKNIYIELSQYHYLDAIEDLVSTHGPEQLLFGTNLPKQDPGQSIAQLNYADISQNDKELIAGKNLENLIKQEEI